MKLAESGYWSGHDSCECLHLFSLLTSLSHHVNFIIRLFLFCLVVSDSFKSEMPQKWIKYFFAFLCVFKLNNEYYSKSGNLLLYAFIPGLARHYDIEYKYYPNTSPDIILDIMRGALMFLSNNNIAAAAAFQGGWGQNVWRGEVVALSGAANPVWQRWQLPFIANSKYQNPATQQQIRRHRCKKWAKRYQWINKFALLWGEAQSCLPKGNL